MGQQNTVYLVSYARKSKGVPKTGCCQKVLESQVDSLKSALEADSRVSNIRVTKG